MQGQGMRGRRKWIGWKLEMEVESLVEADVQICCFMQFGEFFIFYVHKPGYKLKVKWSIRQEEIGRQKK